MTSSSLRQSATAVAALSPERNTLRETARRHTRQLPFSVEVSAEVALRRSRMALATASPSQSAGPM